jgi:hypothetical protein
VARHDDLAEWTAGAITLFERVCADPALWPFFAVVVRTDLAQAVEACRTRTVPAGAVPAFSNAGWTAAHLPTHENAALLLLGCRIEALCVARKHRGDPPYSMREAGALVGVDWRTAQRAVRVMQDYAAVEVALPAERSAEE